MNNAVLPIIAVVYFQVGLARLTMMNHYDSF